MLHEVASMVHLLLFVCAVPVLVEYASPKVLVRISSLLSIFPIVLSRARILGNDRQLEVLVPHHTIVHVAIVHGVAMTQVRGHGELVVVGIDQVGASLLLVAGLLPRVLLLLERAAGGLSDHGVSGTLVGGLRLLIE